MILIQDGSQNTNVDKPLRIIGDPYKVQVRASLRLDAEGRGAGDTPAVPAPTSTVCAASLRDGDGHPARA